MEKTTMKANESRPSLSSLRSSFCSLYDSINQLCHLYKGCIVSRNGEKEINITKFLAFVVQLQSVILEFLAIQELVRQRKEANSIPKDKDKGNIFSMCFNFSARIQFRMMEDDVVVIGCEIAGLTDIFLALARELRPELFSSFQAKNMTSTEMAMSLFPRLTEDIGMNNKEPLKTLLLPD